MGLKYLFTAYYKDGTTYQQNPEDISRLDTSRSCFYDIKKEKLSQFILRNENTLFGVNLEDGSFIVNGQFFFMHDTNFPLKNIELYFYRRHRHLFKQDGTEISHEIYYQVGFDAEDSNGNKVQRIMTID